MVKVIDTNVLVIGGGGAAARAALEARQRGAGVAMVMKGLFGKCGTTAYKVVEIAGYNAADGQVDPEDSPEEHLKDILAAAAWGASPPSERARPGLPRGSTRR